MLSTPLWEWVIQRFGKKTSAFGICVSDAGSKAWGGCREGGRVREVALEPESPGGWQG